MRVVLLGCPGAGKGTQARVLCERYGMTHLSTGDLFRAEIAGKTPLGLRVADYLKHGTLVPDEVVVEMVAGKLEGTPSWLLDGFPRTLEQAYALDKYLREAGSRIDAVLYLSMKEEEVVSRLTSRRSCPSCKAVFNLLSRPPRQEGKCDECAAALVQREDDTEGTVRKRLMVYEDLTKPLVAYYKSEHEFREVDGAKSPDGVTRELVDALDGVRGAA